MSIRDQQDMTPRTLINPKSISAAIEYFFGRGELSQVVDQTNPLSQLTHERRLSALGPGGLNRKRAGFDVRDVHISHYGRICPIETPEGTNIGLISSLCDLRRRGRVRLPDHAVSQGDQEEADRRGRLAAGRRGDRRPTWRRPTPRPTASKITEDRVIARFGGDFALGAVRRRCSTSTSAPSRWSASRPGLIPFLEHDDANRALMGSNMQRQAVPLLVTEPPIVATGLEKDVAQNSGMVVRAEQGRHRHLRRRRRASRSTSASTRCASSSA